MVSLITLLVCVIDVVCSLNCTIPKTDEVCYKITGLEYSSDIPFFIHYKWNYDELLVGKTFKVKRGTDEFSYEMTSCDTTIIIAVR